MARPISTSPTPLAALRPLLLLAAGLAVSASACSDDDGGGDMDGGVTLDTGSALAIDSFTVTSTAVAPGATVTLAWSTTGAESVKLTAEPGGVIAGATATSGSVETSSIAQTTSYTLEAAGGGDTVRSTVVVTLVSGPAPTVTMLGATPNPVDYNASYTISYAVTDATNVRLTVSGTEVVNGPDLTGSITQTASNVVGHLAVLEATGEGGMTTRTLTVQVIPPPGVEVEPNDTTGRATQLDSMGNATASLESATDVDYFRIDVPEGGWVRAVTSDGMGGCAVDQDMALESADGTVLTTGSFATFVFNSSNQAIGACRQIEPRADAAARGLAAGTYYVRVESGQFQPPTGNYVISVTSGPGGCGNGIVETGEQCDDGNMVAGDGCSATCTATSLYQVADTDTAATVFTGSNLAPYGSELVQIDTTGPAVIEAEVGSSLLGQCTTRMRLVLLDSSLAELGSSSQISLSNSTYPCGRFDPDVTAAATLTAAGRYYLRVEPLDASAMVSSYQVTVRAYAGTGCGNGYRENDELCDDGVATDRCTATCTLNPLPAASAQVPVRLGTSFAPYERIRISLGAQATLTATVTSAGTSTTGACGFSTRMGLLQASTTVSVIGLGPTGEECGGITHPGSSGYAAALTAGTYDMVILNGGTGPGGTVTVRSATVAVACGNGVPETSAGEECDDGNLSDGDACRNDCTYNSVSASETEPNDGLTTANPVTVTPAGPVTVISAALQANSDVDIFQVSLPANPQLRVLTYTSATDRTACAGSLDTIVYLVDGSGTTVYSNDDRGDISNNLCSLIDSADSAAVRALAAGDYYLVVQSYQSGSSGSYFMDVQVQ